MAYDSFGGPGGLSPPLLFLVTKPYAKPIKETLMNRLLIVVGLIVVCVAGLGFYFGYFRIGSDSTDGKTHITLTVDQKKIQEDEKKVVEKVQGKD